jgi:hypothetical protein
VIERKESCEKHFHALNDNDSILYAILESPVAGTHHGSLGEGLLGEVPVIVVATLQSFSRAVENIRVWYPT